MWFLEGKTWSNHSRQASGPLSSSLSNVLTLLISLLPPQDSWQCHDGSRCGGSRLRGNNLDLRTSGSPRPLTVCCPITTWVLCTHQAAVNAGFQVTDPWLMGPGNANVSNNPFVGPADLLLRMPWSRLLALSPLGLLTATPAFPELCAAWPGTGREGWEGQEGPGRGQFPQWEPTTPP